MRERQFRVHGQVQGVGFRWWTRSQARRLGLSGTVTNCPDGTVRILARGADPHLAELERLLAAGPPGARVERVDVGDATGVPVVDFVIVRSPE